MIAESLDPMVPDVSVASYPAGRSLMVAVVLEADVRAPIPWGCHAQRPPFGRTRLRRGSFPQADVVTCVRSGGTTRFARGGHDARGHRQAPRQTWSGAEASGPIPRSDLSSLVRLQLHLPGPASPHPDGPGPPVRAEEARGSDAPPSRSRFKLPRRRWTPRVGPAHGTDTERSSSGWTVFSARVGPLSPARGTSLHA